MEKQTIQPEEKKEPTSADSASAAASAKEAATAGEDELSKCQKEREEYLDGWKRAKAELLNYKKDEAQRFEQIIKLVNEGLIKDLLVTLDSFDLAALSPYGRSPEGREKEGLAQKGLYLIRSQLMDILRAHGLEPISVSEGQPFNPENQEAIAEVDSDKPSGTVIEEVAKGYLLNGRVIRPARVKVAK